MWETRIVWFLLVPLVSSISIFRLCIFTFFSFRPTFLNFLRVNLFFVSFLWFDFYHVLLVGSSSSTHVSGQRAAWPNAGSGLSSSVTTLQRTRQTCWWRLFSCSLRPLLLLGNYRPYFSVISPPPWSHFWLCFFFLFFFFRLTFVRSVGHVNEFLGVPQFSTGGLPSLPSSALFLWLEEQPAGSQPQQPAHRQVHTRLFPLCHKNMSHLTFSYIQTRHTLTSCSCALLFQRQVKLLFSCLSRVAADYTEIKNDFMASRESLPVMFIATPKEKKLSIWTKKAPSVQVSRQTIQIHNAHNNTFNRWAVCTEFEKKIKYYILSVSRKKKWNTWGQCS